MASSMKMIHYTVFREDGDYVAQCLDFDVSSFGSTKEEAVEMLREAVELYLDDLPGSTDMPVISETSVGEFAVA
jgi:predicted RNase H-like HicB family nuclease